MADNVRQKSISKNRIHLLDELRGLAVLCMIFYHAFYLMYAMFGMETGKTLFDLCTPLQPFFSSLFIIISGISSRLSHNNTGRGIKLLLIALGFSFVTIYMLPQFNIEGAEIYFGILHLLSVSMLVFSLLHRILDRIPPLITILVFAALYLLTSGVSEGFVGYSGLFIWHLPEVWYETKYLFPLGIFNSDFYSADYFPLFPHLFMFLAGTGVGSYVVRGNLPKLAYRKHSNFLSFLGRNALWVYILHQPIIFGILYVINKLF